ncbi:MAG: BLUF domain-containing protein [Gammaproteobacteria bacterium]|nr:BLUF domain-containing protein [Gammaproteobacteria bacterium]
MFLIRILYASEVSSSFQPGDVESILESARHNNSANNITGLLCFNNKYFLQCLEGSRSRVNDTYQRILKDPRHQRVIMLDYREIFKREFDQWSMGYVPQTHLTRNLNMRYSATPEFDPFEMSGESVYQLLASIRDNIPSV